MSAWSIAFAWEATTQSGNFDIFWDAASVIMKSPFCVAEGLKSDIWYTLGTEPEVNFKVCPACYEGIFCAFGSGQHFTTWSNNHDADSPVVCDMFRETPRARMYMLKYGESIDKDCFRLFDTLVRAVCDTPTCNRDMPTGNRYWYGYTDAHFCEECHALFVKDTPLADRLDLKRELLPQSFICDIYSPRMREKWKVACETDDPGPFREYARYRAQVYEQTMPELRMLLEMMRMRMMMSLSLGHMSMMMSAGDSINNMAGNVSHSWTVNASSGFTGTGGSEMGASADAQAQGAMADVSRMDDVTKGDYLESRWRAVE